MKADKEDARCFKSRLDQLSSIRLDSLASSRLDQLASSRADKEDARRLKSGVTSSLHSSSVPTLPI